MKMPRLPRFKFQWPFRKAGKKPEPLTTVESQKPFEKQETTRTQRPEFKPVFKGALNPSLRTCFNAIQNIQNLEVLTKAMSARSGLSALKIVEDKLWKFQESGRLKGKLQDAVLFALNHKIPLLKERVERLEKTRKK